MNYQSSLCILDTSPFSDRFFPSRGFFSLSGHCFEAKGFNFEVQCLLSGCWCVGVPCKTAPPGVGRWWGLRPAEALPPSSVSSAAQLFMPPAQQRQPSRRLPVLPCHRLEERTSLSQFQIPERKLWPTWLVDLPHPISSDGLGSFREDRAGLPQWRGGVCPQRIGGLGPGRRATPVSRGQAAPDFLREVGIWAFKQSSFQPMWQPATNEAGNNLICIMGEAGAGKRGLLTLNPRIRACRPPEMPLAPLSSPLGAPFTVMAGGRTAACGLP